MATCSCRWLTVCVTVVILCLDTRPVHADLVDDLSAPDLLDKDKKSWPSDPQIQDSDSPMVSGHQSDKREWNIDQDDMELAMDNEDVKRKWGSNMKVWGKRHEAAMDSAEKRAWNNNLRVWGKRDGEDSHNDDKRQWGSDSLRVWGKREWPSKKWGNLNSMKVWGKRDQEAMAKRKWGNNMRVWGKRDGEESTEAEKRKWDKVMKVWGKRNDLSEDEKRAWDNQFKVWGKREDESSDAISDNHITPLLDQNAISADKKAWDSNMRVWGKRAISKRSIENINDDYKRAWDTGSMRVWGKRRNQDEGPKRSWKNNVMRVWGKRSLDDFDNSEDSVDKRNWSSNNMRTWGKRRWNTDSMRTWGKRAWDNPSMRTWGKRSDKVEPSELIDTLNNIYNRQEGVYRR